MYDPPTSVLVLAPLGTDGEVVAGLAGRCGLSVRVCADGRDFRAALSSGGDCGENALFTVISEEGADEDTGAVLQQVSEREPIWSSLPAVFLARSTARPPPAYRMLTDRSRTQPAVLLERPVSPAMLQSVFLTQAEARRRQFEIRDLLGRLAEAERRKAFLLDELRHRSRNTLSVLQSLFTLTARRHDDLEAFVSAFSGRIRMLAQAHGALAEDEGQAQDLRKLVVEHVAPYCVDADQLRFDGPPVCLLGRAALDMAMVLHELATNAGKYGALSVAEGVVTVAWERESDGDGLEVSWTERGGPPVTAPERRGLGSELIQSLTFGDASDIRLEYRREGVFWRVRLTASAYSVTGAADG